MQIKYEEIAHVNCHLLLIHKDGIQIGCYIMDAFKNTKALYKITHSTLRRNILRRKKHLRELT